MFCVYGIKNCNTVKKSLEWLNSNKIEFEFFDVVGQKLISNQKICAKGVVLGGKWWFPD